MNEQQRVLIVGGGWAGMAAALELDRHGVPVTVLESARHLGGRARSVSVDGITFDNGQHLLIGAYRTTLTLLTRMGTRAEEILARGSLSLEVLDSQGNLRIKAPPLPAPFHLLWGLLSASGLTASEKYLAIRMSLLLSLRDFRLNSDMAVSELLAHYRQGEGIIRRFWEPLCLATLNTPMEKASAVVFLRVLQDSFSRRRHDADLLIPRVPLGALFCERAARYLEAAGHHRVETSQRVSAIKTGNGRLSGVETAEGVVEADTVIIATSPSSAVRLLEPLTPLQPLAQQLSRLGSQPIITLYLHYPDAPAPASPMLGMSGTLAQWVFDRRVCDQPGWYAVVISSEGEHSQWDNERLRRRIESELAGHLNDWPTEAEHAVVIREKRATFECRVGSNELRPGNRTELPGLWLAGDYTDTGYPATLEGAVLSGVQCAHQIIAQRQSRH